MILYQDTWREIILHLNRTDVNEMRVSSRMMNGMIGIIESDDEYWKKKLSARLGFEVYEKYENENWKQMYISIY